ncbi:MAG TPA: PilT/PilU family type 4a pilus ATPase [Fimbriimonadaceae bacterium]|nr:MAG: type IV pili twitching motility protein PilT [Armatimonadota bacterium]HQU18560.1 PilT/PilU family type 4a pilus ATPase [Fimbriimonadaceae bacterium]
MRDPASINIHELIDIGYHERASDVFVKGGSPPMMRLHAKVQPLPGEWPVIDPYNAQRMIGGIMTEKQRRKFEDHMEMDLAFSVGETCRVRANIHMQRGTWGIVCRIIPTDILNIEQLGLPPVLQEFAKIRQGLVLFTGPTGSGKTTSLAAIIDVINCTRPVHIVTIEDPLEFVHRDKASYITQREVGIDTEDFQPALRAVVREAPDVILIGEMRDVATFNVAMQAGETGHLVFSTVHTSSAYETMDRIVNMFPPHEKNHLCIRLASALRAIVAQKLVPRADGQGRVAACEILVVTPTVQKIIEDGHFSDLYHAINEGEFWGMQTMNQSLLRYVKAGVISEEIALNYAGIASELKQMLRR